MAWLTKIRADAQVDYRLREQAGCGVVEADAAETIVLDDSVDAAVDYRLRPEGDGHLVWVGSGMSAFGYAAGDRLDDEAKDAARRIMNGCHPATGARLLASTASVRVHPDAQLTVARLTEAIEALAAEKGVEPADLLAGKPKQQRELATQQRMVHRFGEGQRLQVGTLHKLARAVGLDLADVYGTETVERAWASKDKRIDTRVRGWDLVLDLPKSDSALSGLMGDLGEREFRELVQQAKNDTVRQAEEWIGYAVTGEDGEKVRIATGGLLGWSVEHLAARPVTPGEPGDPHLHVHVTIANMALCEDGEWRAIANSGQDFHRHAKALDAYFKARVRELTYATFGIRREYNPETRAWEIRHVPEELRDAFSRRHIALDERVGADASREDRQRIADETRRAKVDADASGMRSSWRTRAEAVVGDVDAMVAAAAPGPPDGGGAGIDGPGGGPQRPGPDDLARIVFDPETGLTASEKSFSRAQLLAAVATAMEFGIGAEPGLLDELADQVLAVEGYAVRLPHVGSTVMSSMDRYTTRDILDAEELVTSQALVRFDEGAVQLTTEQAAAAMSVFEVANGFALSGEQRAAIERTLTAGHGIDAHIGAAGTGKSTLMEACRIAWDATGHTYAGATVSAVAAKSLDDASGIPARSIASWLTQIRDGNGLTGIDVLVVDEATMSNDRQAAALMKEAQRTGTKLVAIGDPKQLQAIGPGGWFKEVHRLVGGLTLIENRRQRNDAERAALEVWRTGDHEQALRILADTGRVHATESAIEAHGQILTTWDEVRGRWTDPHDLIDSLTVLAAKNTDVDLLNLGAQQIRRQRGELGAEHRYALSGGADINFAVGDLVRVRQNDYRSRRGEGPDVLNGYRAVVTAIDEDHRVEITWRDKKTNDTVSAWFDPQAISSGALSLGYAMTVAASQGLTSEVSLLYGHGANAFAVYPGITRGRAENHLWLPLQVVEDDETQARLGAARTETERLQRAVTAFARFLGQDRGDSMVSDLLREPPTPAVRLPEQASVREHERARGESEAALRRAHAATAVSPGRARQAQEEAQRVAAEAQADTAAADDVAVQVQPATEDDARERAANEKRLAEIQRRREMASVQSWKTRPYGKRSDAELARVIKLAYERAGIAERGAAQTAEKARVLEERLAQEREAGQTRGQAFVAAAATLLDQAEAKAQEAAQQLARAANARKEAEERDRYLRDYLEPKKNLGPLERLRAGVTKKQIAADIADVTAERAAWHTEASEARSAANAARVAAWEMIRTSKFAGQFRDVDAQKPAPDDVATVTERLTKMREQLPDIEISLDRRDAQTLTRLQGEVTQYTDAAAKSRKTVAAGQAEQALRKTIATKYPELHDIETKARRSHIVAQKRAAAEQSRARAQESAGYHRQPPSQGLGGPSLPGR
ncbi:conjugative relaxase domain-containing protein, TrwC/TraI family [Streptomyces misionensis]|uniref:Conjugative relaxase domain-containing protein, TrwC/TraI family n=3 Tax=Streptomyces misionensis TaxID=67331 RepID=A0A1H5K1U6_9ACTN|nr:MobF family relaxase [Streptomyces misionensis]SEE58660.1 conjugative relaxase domain-containing protein, TrwC/TraI family [Streptomyces misionensis]